MLRCVSWRTWAVLGGIVLVLALAVPSSRGLLPLLVVAACPLSMLAMGVGMARAGRRDRSEVSQ